MQRTLFGYLGVSVVAGLAFAVAAQVYGSLR